MTIKRKVTHNSALTNNNTPAESMSDLDFTNIEAARAQERLNGEENGIEGIKGIKKR